MTQMVYVNEIPSLKVHVYNNNNVITYKEEMYTLLLPHLCAEFRNKNDNNVAVSCFPTFPFDEHVENVICDYITSNLKDENTNIFFDNVYEGHTISCISGIHKIINKINLNPEKCYFISGGMQAQSLYNDYCDKEKIVNKINIIVLNSWERHICRHTVDHELAKNFTFEIKNKEKLFLSFNRIVRIHRIILLALIYEKNLVERSYYSFFPEATYGGVVLPLLSYVQGKISKSLYEIVERNINDNIEKFPLILNNIDASNTNTVLESDLELYKNSYFSLVTETFFFSDKNSSNFNTWEEHSVFFSEKIFKPIICKHPFILVSRPFSLKYLRDIGYKTFHPYIDESYDLIEDNESRLIAIANEVERLSRQTPSEWIDWLSNVKDIVEHNQHCLLSKTRDDHQYIEK